MGYIQSKLWDIYFELLIFGKLWNIFIVKANYGIYFEGCSGNCTPLYFNCCFLIFGTLWDIFE